MAETPAAGAVEAQQAQQAAEAAKTAADLAIADAANAAAAAQANAAESARLAAEKTATDLSRYDERFNTWREEINQNLSASQQAAQERLQKLEQQQEAIAAGMLQISETLKPENLKLLIPLPSQVEAENPEQLSQEEEAARKAAQTAPRKPRRQRI